MKHLNKKKDETSFFQFFFEYLKINFHRRISSLYTYIYDLRPIAKS